jgi:Ca2+-binding EF-hand superfamily protein
LKDKAKIIFDLYDLDKSQMITTEEMTILLKTAITSLNAMVKKPSPTMEEIQKKTTNIFKTYDINKDGTISLKEFQSFVSTDPEILQ